MGREQKTDGGEGHLVRVSSSPLTDFLRNSLIPALTQFLSIYTFCPVFFPTGF